MSSILILDGGHVHLVEGRPQQFGVEVKHMLVLWSQTNSGLKVVLSLISYVALSKLLNITQVLFSNL